MTTAALAGCQQDGSTDTGVTATTPVVTEVSNPPTTPVVTEAPEPPTTHVVTEAPEPSAAATETATEFVAAYASYDIEGASSYLAEDADLSRLEGGQEKWRFGNQWLEAQGFVFILDTCEELDSSPLGTSVRCPFDFHGIRSDEIGLGPFGGSRFDLTVLEDKVVFVSLKT